MLFLVKTQTNRERTEKKTKNVTTRTQREIIKNGKKSQAKKTTLCNTKKRIAFLL